ncbi:MAG: UvrD-helicase domain-containing protein [Anaerolineae bacterium]
MTTRTLLDQMLLSDAQREAAAARGCDVVVTAGAGTGKTRTLVARYLSLLADGVPLRHIVAITFTRKAAREMRNRVRLELGRYLNEADLGPDERVWWQDQYQALDAARVGTIHNLCIDILRAHPAEAGIDPRFDVLDEAQSRILQREAVDAALAWAADDPDAAVLFRLLPEWALRRSVDGLLKARLTAQAALARLPVEIGAHWQTVLAQRQAAALARLTARSDWQANLAVLRRNPADNPDDRREQMRRQVLAAVAKGGSGTDQLRHLAVLDEINLSVGSAKAWPGGKVQADEVKAALKGLRDLWCSQALFTLSLNEMDQLMEAALPPLRGMFERVCAHYQASKQARHVLDFDDLEADAIRLLEENESVRGYWQSVVRALLVDEFQDSNGRQLTLVRLLCPQPGKLFIVGDAKQSIYRFRGADVAVFRQEGKTIEAAGGTVRQLQKSYRAHRGLVQGLNDLLRPILGEPAAETPAWVAPFAPLTHHREVAAEGITPPYIELHLTVGSKQGGALDRAARALVGRLADLVDGSSLQFGDIAILCRASGSFRYYEDALDEASIPFLTVAGKGFYQRPEIRDLLNALQAIADPSDDLALAGFLRSPGCALSDIALYQLGRAREAGASLWQTLQANVPLDGIDAERASRAVLLIRSLHQLVGRAAVADVLKAYLDETGYRAALRQAGLHRAARNVAKLLADAHDSQLISVGAFLEYVAALRDSGSREGEARATVDGAVQIMSVHAAKGLEFPIVVIGDASHSARSDRDTLIDPECGVLLKLTDEDGLTPALFQLCQAQDKDRDDAEAKRLLYVVATRAEQKLLINGCFSLNEKNRRPMRLSGWLKQTAGLLGLAQCELDDYDENGSRALTFALRVAETPVALTVYEPGYAGLPAAPSSSPSMEADEVVLPPPLFPPIPIPTAVTEDQPALPQRVWQVVSSAQRPVAPAWVIGSLVHEALAAWRFPGADFDAWARARAQAYGLADGRRLQNAVTETTRLLARFRRHALFREVHKADRRLHEVPYSLLHDGQGEQGVIDVLFLRDGRWTLVDFKTDRVRHEAEFRELLSKKDYMGQVRRYGAAVAHLIGQTPRLFLCMLNFAGEVYPFPIDAGGAG